MDMNKLAKPGGPWTAAARQAAGARMHPGFVAWMPRIRDREAAGVRSGQHSGGHGERTQMTSQTFYVHGDRSPS
jgi:hypothetical protein